MSEILSEKQVKALQVLSSGGTYKQASKAAQCGIRTVFRWAKLPEFQARLRGFAETRMETVEQVIREQECIKIQDLVPQSLDSTFYQSIFATTSTALQPKTCKSPSSMGAGRTAPSRRKSDQLVVINHTRCERF